MRKKKPTLGRESIVVIVVIVSIILYGAGLLSGLSFSRYVEKRIEEKTEQDISFIVDYVKNLDSDLQSIQIQERFISSLDENNTCKFADVYFSHLKQNLKYFWDLLPARLEQYERGRALSDEYLDLKQQYIRLSLRAWIISNNNYRECKTDVVPILYFYSTECEECVKQGEALDQLKDALLILNKTVIVFTLDFNYPEASLELVKQYFQVKEVPAIIINDRVLQGRLFTSNEILFNLKENGLENSK
ncbi:hypothetical protein AYK26_01755 [Euryarchaeota archaeon SM23-78]|nr:MAG: hypothetical protein AYK26_01755 [Euryarchaeota archaeon SM23-78]MBW3000851.1 hypothetical protein [Candidatus Woesearchaeota archaeon]